MPIKRAKLKREGERAEIWKGEAESRDRGVNERRVRGEREREHSERDQRERDFLLHYSLYKDAEIKFFSKIKLAYQEFDTHSDQNKIQYLLEEKLKWP